MAQITCTIRNKEVLDTFFKECIKYNLSVDFIKWSTEIGSHKQKHVKLKNIKHVWVLYRMIQDLVNSGYTIDDCDLIFNVFETENSNPDGLLWIKLRFDGCG